MSHVSVLSHNCVSWASRALPLHVSPQNSPSAATSLSAHSKVTHASSGFFAIESQLDLAHSNKSKNEILKSFIQTKINSFAYLNTKKYSMEFCESLILNGFMHLETYPLAILAHVAPVGKLDEYLEKLSTNEIVFVAPELHRNTFIKLIFVGLAKLRDYCEELKIPKATIEEIEKSLQV